MDNKLLIAIVVLIIIVAIFALRGCGGNDSGQEYATQVDREAVAAKSYEMNINTNNFESVLYDKIKSEILTWDEEGIYAISFFVYSNEDYEYKGYENASMWSISYNTEEDCEGAGKYSEERWNYAFWRQNETPIIDIDVPNKYADVLYDWYAEKGITDIGEEDTSNDYDEDMNYIGKGPAGHYELICLAADIGKRLQEEGVIKEHFGEPIPIIIHGLEYAWYDIEATETANPNGEAKTFLKAAKKMGLY